MQITRGQRKGAVKMLIYGVAGVGKSTFASQFPNPVFIDTEGSTDHMDVARTPKPLSWTELLSQINYFIQHPNELQTLVIDTLDWAEKLCIESFCAAKKLSGVEDMPYGKGYVYIADEFGKMLNMLEDLKNRGVNIVLTAHASIRKFEQPDEMGAYDRWELKLSKKTSPLCKEWVDALIFANYKTIVVNVDGQGATKGKNKATGGKRVMYTTYTPSWDAKNRFGLPDEVPFEFASIAHLVQAVQLQPITAPEEPAAATAPETPREMAPLLDDGIPPALSALMAVNGVLPIEIQAAVAQRGVYPADTPISAYDPEYVRGVLIAAWPQVEAAILANRGKEPF